VDGKKVIVFQKVEKLVAGITYIPAALE